MVIITITNITTEITLNIALWLLKKTLYGTYYISSYLLSNNKYTQSDIDILKQEILLLKKELNNNKINNIELNNIELNNDNSDVESNDSFIILDKPII